MENIEKIEFYGAKYWYLNGQKHRIDGPAIEWADGSKEWYLNGDKLTEQEWQAKISSMNHKQTIIKVNRSVDCAIAPLVLALNEFAQIITVESCEGKNESAYVSFHHIDTWKELVEFVRNLSEQLSKDITLADAFYTLSVEWAAGGNEPLGYLRVPYLQINLFAKAISALKNI